MFKVEDVVAAAEQARDAGEFLEIAVREDWTEGLPVARPAGRVSRFLEELGWNPEDVLGTVTPWGAAPVSVTLGHLTICSLMAGCLPSYGRVVRAAAEAMLDPAFDLAALPASRGAFAPLAIVSGAVVNELGFSSGHSVFAGAGSRANAAVGRALALLYHNILAGTPLAVPDLGGPNLFYSCLVELPEQVWGPLHAERGYTEAASGVTVVGASTHDGVLLSAMRIHSSGESFDAIADTIRTLGNLNTQDLGGEVVVTICPPGMEVMAREGWSRRDVQNFLFQRARRRVSELRRVGILTAEKLEAWRGRRALAYYNLRYDDEQLPVVDEPGSILCVPCGGRTNWWGSVVHGAGRYGGRAVTRPIPPAV